MDYLHGTITFKDQVIFKKVSLWIRQEQNPTSSTGSWYGLIRHGSPAHINMRTIYRLKLEDGREGDIQIKGSSATAIQFEGTGPLA
jgi:hypothetical protein